MKTEKTETWHIELNRQEILDIRAVLWIAYNQCDNLSDTEVATIVQLEQQLKELP